VRLALDQHVVWEVSWARAQNPGNGCCMLNPYRGWHTGGASQSSLGFQTLLLVYLELSVCKTTRAAWNVLR